MEGMQATRAPRVRNVIPGDVSRHLKVVHSQRVLEVIQKDLARNARIVGLTIQATLVTQLVAYPQRHIGDQIRQSHRGSTTALVKVLGNTGAGNGQCTPTASTAIATASTGLQMTARPR